MERALFYLRIFPGTEAEYERRHAEIWPELVEEIRSSGLRNMSGFRRGTDVWYYVEAEPDAKTAFEIHGPKPKNQEWNRYFRDVIAEITTADGDLIWYKEMFHSGGDPLPGPMSRSLIHITIDPERAADYDGIHADPWPDMMAAIEAAGYRNYSGFRRGGSVVYYGEYYPDIETVSARMAEYEVNARWGKAFEGIITTIVDADGKLITADEVYHQD
jgi:L-rhamnose mutarotase